MLRLYIRVPGVEAGRLASRILRKRNIRSLQVVSSGRIPERIAMDRFGGDCKFSLGNVAVMSVRHPIYEE